MIAEVRQTGCRTTFVYDLENTGTSRGEEFDVEAPPIQELAGVGLRSGRRLAI